MVPTGGASPLTVPVPSVALVIVVVLAVGLVMGLGTRPALNRLPEPELDSAQLDSAQRDSAALEIKTPYRDLPGRGFVLVVALTSMALTALATLTLPARFWPPWLVLCTVGVLLAAIDARTTWLPWRLTWLGWLAMLIAGLVCVALGASWLDLARLFGCGLLAGLWYVVIYLITRRRLGLGDVWLAPLIGAPSGLISFTGLYLAMLLGSLAGGLHGLVLMIRGHRGGFPYAPSIIAGPFLALIVLRLPR